MLFAMLASTLLIGIGSFL
ncbi:hypothetical protein M3610_05465 [Neobacillus sp. MER 74]|nr:hypothetical protein [Neobacillus sp. MER 74]